MKKQLVITLSILGLLLILTSLAVLYGKGYRFTFERGKPELSGTGMLVATSSPDGAQVFINGHLTTATDNTINLAPGEYEVKIFKDGYFPWEKKIKIQEQIVSKAEALLFSTTPKLESITSTGVENPSIDPSFTRIAYAVASGSARKNGVYVLDMTARPILTLQSASTQIADDTLAQFSKARLIWSPSGQDILATISASLTDQTTYLLRATDFNSAPQDVTATLAEVQANWDTDRIEKDTARLLSLKKELRTLTQENFKVLSWSLDETKILYEATGSATLPIIIKPSLIGTNPTKEQRNLEQGNLYVYDLKEDKNYQLPFGSTEQNWKLEIGTAIYWMPDSKHLLYVQDKKINIMEYDGTNITTIYGGPFLDGYVYPWPNGSKIVILTNLGNPTISPNLYTIGIK